MDGSHVHIFACLVQSVEGKVPPRSAAPPMTSCRSLSKNTCAVSIFVSREDFTPNSNANFNVALMSRLLVPFYDVNVHRKTYFLTNFFACFSWVELTFDCDAGRFQHPDTITTTSFRTQPLRNQSWDIANILIPACLSYYLFSW